MSDPVRLGNIAADRLRACSDVEDGDQVLRVGDGDVEVVLDGDTAAAIRGFERLAMLRRRAAR